MQALADLAKELGYPSNAKLWQAVERRRLDVTKDQVLNFVRSQGERQVFAARPKYDGKIVATKINDRWAADLIDYTAKPSQSKEFQRTLPICAHRAGRLLSQTVGCIAAYEDHRSRAASF